MGNHDDLGSLKVDAAIGDVGLARALDDAAGREVELVARQPVLRRLHERHEGEDHREVGLHLRGHPLERRLQADPAVEIVRGGGDHEDHEQARELAIAIVTLADIGEIVRAERTLMQLQRELPNDPEVNQALKNLSARRTLNEGGYEKAQQENSSYRDMLKDKAEAAYARSDLLEKRRPLMDAWAEHCGRTPATVVELAAERARMAG